MDEILFKVGYLKYRDFSVSQIDYLALKYFLLSYQNVEGNRDGFVGSL